MKNYAFRLLRKRNLLIFLAPWFVCHFLHAQCNPPSSIWLHTFQTSTSFTLKWVAVSEATQYQIRYYETAVPSVKTIVDNFGPPPYTLSGLNRNTNYTIQIRSKCSTGFSDWGTAVHYLTSNGSGMCSPPTGVTASTGLSNILVSWSSSGAHTIRYRPGTSGDWLIPAGGLSVMASPFSIAGLPSGTYQVEVKSNCNATSSTYVQVIAHIGGCATPSAPAVTAGSTNATVVLPAASGVTGYHVQYRQGNSGGWITAGTNITTPVYTLNPPLEPSTVYQVQTQAICPSGTSAYSPSSTFTTQEAISCLANKNFGKQLTPTEIAQINNNYNAPSPFNLGSMIAVNDGGLIFRAFQNEAFNQITQLTTQYRNFHVMDEDFNSKTTLTSLMNSVPYPWGADQILPFYNQTIKPKNTTPEGTPAFTAFNKGLYNIYRNTHGFMNITAATELLFYPYTWKEKIYNESEWSNAGPAGIRNAFENYTKKFIDEYAPPNGTSAQILVHNYQIGNELWDYPVKSDYHALLTGARNAFVGKYGAKSLGGWKMKLVVGAFQAIKENDCGSALRDYSNCGGSLERHDFIGDYLNVADCEVLKDLDAIDCHPYSLGAGTLQWTYPENPSSETRQIRNLAGWRDANKNASSGILSNVQLWSSEFGFDSNPNTGVGEKTQSAYLIRGLMLHSRYHFSKVFFYNGYDHSKATDAAYSGLFQSSGFWKLGTNPNNSAWASPFIAHGATPKPSWHGMMDLKNRFNNHVFYKALYEDQDAFVYLIAKSDGTDPYLIFWAPQRTTDADINTDIPISKTITWSEILPGSYSVNTTNAQVFAESTSPGQVFSSASGVMCGTTTLTTIRKNPAFIQLVACNACTNVTQAGQIVAPVPTSGSSGFNPGLIASSTPASGGTGGVVVYQWQQSSNNSTFVDISNETGLVFDPPALTQTTYYRRAAKRTICNDYVYTPSIAIQITGLCSNIASFLRRPHTNVGCNAAGDYYFEIVMANVTVSDEVIISGLPSGGISTDMSSLNNVALNTATFNYNLAFITNTSYRWKVNAANGPTQTLRLFFCWSNSYPNPVSNTTATVLCSGIVTPCALSANLMGRDNGDLNESVRTPAQDDLQFQIQPNPGKDRLILTYFGPETTQATISIVSVTGQVVSSQDVLNIEGQDQWIIDTAQLSQGIYIVRLQTNTGVKHRIWERL